MRKVVVVVGLIGSLGCAGWMSHGASEPPSTERPVADDGEEVVDDRLETVRATYERYQADELPGYEELPLSASLRKAWKRSQNQIDYDPLIDAQDYDIDAVEVALDGDDVVARFTNFGKATEVRWVMVEEDGAWVVDDFRSGSGSLREVLE